MGVSFLKINLLLLAVCSVPEKPSAQTFGFYGGAGASLDRFSFNSGYSKNEAPASLQPGPLAIMGVRCHTRQDFDILLDASLGIVKIKVPMPEAFEGKLTYDQIQSLIMIGSGLNIPVQNAHLLPYIQIGASFLDFWSLTASSHGSTSIATNERDFKSNRWSVVCGAGVDYQFKLFLSSGINLRLVIMPLDTFKEPAVIYYSISGKSYDFSLNGKIMQAQLTYRINLPVNLLNSRRNSE